MKARASFHGATADDAMSKATAAFDRFFGEGRWEFVYSDARPVVVDDAGRIASWEVEFEAEEKA